MFHLIVMILSREVFNIKTLGEIIDLKGFGV